MKEDDTKKLTKLEISNVIDKSINMSILSRLLKLNLINVKEYYTLKEKVQNFYFKTIN